MIYILKTIVKTILSIFILLTSTIFLYKQKDASLTDNVNEMQYSQDYKLTIDETKKDWTEFVEYHSGTTFDYLKFQEAYSWFDSGLSINGANIYDQLPNLNIWYLAELDSPEFNFKISDYEIHAYNYTGPNKPGVQSWAMSSYVPSFVDTGYPENWKEYLVEVDKQYVYEIYKENIGWQSMYPYIFFTIESAEESEYTGYFITNDIDAFTSWTSDFSDINTQNGYYFLDEFVKNNDFINEPDTLGQGFGYLIEYWFDQVIFEQGDEYYDFNPWPDYDYYDVWKTLDIKVTNASTGEDITNLYRNNEFDPDDHTINSASFDLPSFIRLQVSIKNEPNSLMYWFDLEDTIDFTFSTLPDGVEPDNTLPILPPPDIINIDNGLVNISDWYHKYPVDTNGEFWLNWFTATLLLLTIIAIPVFIWLVFRYISKISN